MKSIRSLIDMPVICSGKKAGRVAQVRLSDDLLRMDGLWVDAGLSGTRFIPAENICRLGDVAILADSPGRRMRCDQPPLFLRALTTDGMRAGAIFGAEIDEMTFRVEALELSKGYLDDFLLGRARVRSFTVSPDGKAVIIHPSGDSSGGRKEGKRNEGIHVQGTYDRRSHRRLRRNAVRRDELAD